MAKWHIETLDGNTQVVGEKLHLIDEQSGSAVNAFITDRNGDVVFAVSQHSLRYAKKLDG